MNAIAKRSSRRSLKVVDHHTTNLIYTTNGYDMTFDGRTKSGDPARVVIELHFCDLSYIAELIWKQVKDRQKKIDSVRAALKGETA